MITTNNADPFSVTFRNSVADRGGGGRGDGIKPTFFDADPFSVTFRNSVADRGGGAGGDGIKPTFFDFKVFSKK